MRTAVTGRLHEPLGDLLRLGLTGTHARPTHRKVMLEGVGIEQ